MASASEAVPGTTIVEGGTLNITTDLLQDSFDRVHQGLPELLAGLTPEAVLWRPDQGANSIGWLAWHLTRVQDDHLAGIGETEQVWTSAGYFDRFGLPYPVAAHGYGQTSQDIAAFSVADPELLVSYQDAVHQLTGQVLGSLDESGLARIVDAHWDPPVTAAVRLVSVIGDLNAHLGQIGYVRGLFERLG